MIEPSHLDVIVADHYRATHVRDRIVARREAGLAPWEEQVLARHHVPAGGEFLVVGGGAGRESKALARLGFSVVSVDASPELTDFGRRHASGREQFWCLWPPSDALPEERFDHVALWSQVLANVAGAERRRALLAGAARSLKPRGRLSLSVHELDQTLALIGSDMRVERVGPAAGDLLIAETGETPCYWRYFTTDEIGDLASDAGLALDALVSASELGDPTRSNLMIGLCHRP